jgi:hypothetical protein
MEKPDMKRAHVSFSLIALPLLVAAWPSAAVAQERTTAPEPLRLELGSLAEGLTLAAAPRLSSSTIQSDSQSQRTMMPRPRLAGSATGYVDNAIVGSQLRVRFDSARSWEGADRAEFFYAKCGCYREAGVDPEATGPAPALAGRDPFTTQFIETGLDARDFLVTLEYAPQDRVSVFTDVLIRSIDPNINASATGFGDLRGGVKVALVQTDRRHVTGQLRLQFPTGDPGKGLGNDHASVEPALLYFEQLSDRVTLSGELKYWLPVGGNSSVPADPDGDWAGDILQYGAGVSVEVYSGPDASFAPVIELVGWSVLGGYETMSQDGTLSTFTLAEADGVNVANLKIGGRLSFAGSNSIYVGYGHALTDRHWYDDVVRIEFRRAF